MLAPAAAVVGVVQQHGLEAVEGAGEPGVGRLAGLELLPQGPQLAALLGRQEAVTAGRRRPASRSDLRGQPGLVVDEGVAGVDLDEVVEQQHREDAGEVDRLVGVLGQDEGEQRQVPGVLGGVLPPLTADDGGAPLDLLQPVGLEQEGRSGPAGRGSSSVGARRSCERGWPAPTPRRSARRRP